MSTQAHWESVYSEKSIDGVSWYRPHLETSLRMIRAAAPSSASPIIDVGGGASTLVDDLLAEGFHHLTVIDLSQSAIEASRQRLASRSHAVHWQVGDITDTRLPRSDYAVWHDRAVFHFLVDAASRAAYVRQLRHHLAPDGTVIMATFGPRGPTQCSGLEVQRYDTQGLQNELGVDFTLVEDTLEHHETPGGVEQEFLYARFRYRAAGVGS